MALAYMDWDLDRTQGLNRCGSMLYTEVRTVWVVGFYVAAQAFVRTLCDVRSVPYESYWTQQFIIAYDVYVAITNYIKKTVKKALHRDDPDWRILNACPSCQTEVVGEDTLQVRMLLTMDGNNSLKCMSRRENPSEQGILGRDRERPDSREGGEDYYLSWDENMKDEVTAVALGKYEETGLFITLCRHGFMLAMTDMVRSGEQRKYALACLNRLLSAQKTYRYDVGCDADKTIHRCALCPLVTKAKIRMAVGLMHGHAHNQICQLCYLLLYISGVGIEDLEGCERFFSKLNSLAAKTRYQRHFHRRQAITKYVYHNDNFKVYANLSHFLVNNYWPSSRYPTQMKQFSIADVKVFFTCLDEEKEFLLAMKKQPIVETVEIEYFHVLLDLEKTREQLTTATQAFLGCGLDVPQLTAGLSKEEKKRRRQDIKGIEKTAKDLRELEMKLIRDRQVLETKLDVKTTWTKDCSDWVRVETMANMFGYQKALDRLEAVVARIFELGKAHVAGTGYKMQKHLLSAIRERSKAIQTAIEAYNKAARALDPPKPQLSWSDIMDYTFLSEFDILRHTREDIRQRPSREELQRLHVEIQHLFTYMKEEEDFLLKAESVISAKHPAFAHQIKSHWLERGRFNEVHRKRLLKVMILSGRGPGRR
ncbi:hypothetical protein K435DRAFT_823619 [Dendrothele bispora CBS 962.96]|uniref:CxC2-like cysteine cluster KDZ transposase-associated domain-containing protein n=1 Tax=Dendrothele bispora (strain CBS 962.96) TaxID=1314807 RepID=A0A4S8KXR7_DENBC|nr:hypothetical protein K435DRAFT_823619 [Dendrothele bispora CBS 962.96]